MNNDKLLSIVNSYYADSIKRFGRSPKGVDWNDKTGQILRFNKLLKIIRSGTSFSITDFGCGYGALIYQLDKLGVDFKYLGIDLCNEMLEEARSQFNLRENISFKESKKIELINDYIVASGVFNVKLKASNDDWESYIEHSLDAFNAYSRIGFASNFLSTYSDKEFMQDKLYYADPLKIFDLCKTKYSRNVSLLHDYGLYEFTILVSKEDV